MGSANCFIRQKALVHTLAKPLAVPLAVLSSPRKKILNSRDCLVCPLSQNFKVHFCRVSRHIYICLVHIIWKRASLPLVVSSCTVGLKIDFEWVPDFIPYISLCIMGKPWHIDSLFTCTVGLKIDFEWVLILCSIPMHYGETMAYRLSVYVYCGAKNRFWMSPDFIPNPDALFKFNVV